MSANLLAAVLGVDKSTVSRSVDKLVIMESWCGILIRKTGDRLPCD